MQQASTSPQIQANDGVTLAKRQKLDIENADLKIEQEDSASHSTSSPRLPLSAPAQQGQIVAALRTSQRLHKLGDIELQLLSVAAYLKPSLIPERFLMKYAEHVEPQETEVALKNLKEQHLLLEHNGIKTYYMTSALQKEIRILITEKNEEEALLEQIIKTLISEEKCRKVWKFPYNGYIEDIVLTAIGIWDRVFKYRTLVEKYYKSLEDFAIASYEEINTPGINVLFFSKTIRQLSILFGHNDPKTISIKMCMSIIASKNGKTQQAIDDFDSYIKLIEASADSDMKALLSEALQHKASILECEKKYGDALSIYDSILQLDASVHSIDACKTVHIKHLKCKLTNLMGNSEAALLLCDEIVLESKKLGILIQDVQLTKAKICHSLQKYNEALDLLDSVLAERKLTYDEKHTLVLATINQKAETLEDMGRYDDAQDALTCIHEVLCEKYGEHHVKTMHMKTNIARVMTLNGKIREATVLLNEMIDKVTVKHGKNSEAMKEILDVKREILNMSTKKDKTTEKIDSFLPYRRYYVEVYHLHVDVSESEIESAANKQLEDENWVQAAKDASCIFDKIQNDLGDTCPGLIPPLNIMSIAYNRMKKQNEELTAVQALYRVRLFVLGADKTVTINTQLNLAQLQESMNKKTEALVLYESAYKQIIKIKKNDAPVVISIMRKIADLKICHFEYDAALKTYQTLCNLLSNNSASITENLIEAKYGLVMCYMKLSNIDMAAYLSNKMLQDYLKLNNGLVPINNKFTQLRDFIQNLHERLQDSRRKQGIL